MIRYIVALFLITSVASAQVVDIPDPNLRAVIAASLGKTADEAITVDEMASIGVLHADDAGIGDLTGLKHATNLLVLNLGDNAVSDLSPLSSLTNLTRLDLYDNEVSDISALSGLTNLTELYLLVNEISDISALADLTNLRQLNLWTNPIADTAPLCILQEKNSSLRLDIPLDCDP